MGQVISICTGLFGRQELDLGEHDAVDERLAVEELLQDVTGESYPVEITVECRGLPERANFTKYSPFVVAKVLGKGHADGDEILGRTETVRNSANPMFVTAIMDTVLKELNHDIVFFVHHESSAVSKDDDQLLLAKCEVDLESLSLAAPSSVLVPLVHPGGSGKPVGSIVLTAQQVANVQEEIVMEISAKNLSRRGRAAPNAFVLISRVQASRMIPVAKTNVCRSSTEPVWNEVRAKAYRLCANDDNLPLFLQVFAYDGAGNHRYIGATKTTLSQLLSGGVTQYPVLDDRKIGDKGYVNSGELIISRVSRAARHSFLEYVREGFEINCTFAIDMSASNGKGSKSMHRLDPHDPLQRPNDYMQVIKKVCKVVGRYDKDQCFPVYGFGASIGDSTEPSHCFPISLNPEEVEIQGANQIANAYIHCLDYIQPQEPTYLAPVIEEVMKETRKAGLEKGPSYQLLIILTDGDASDMTEAEHAIVEASSLPMSILIIGMGDPEKQSSGFTKMARFDDADLRSVISGSRLKRDVVNFMEYHEYKKLTFTEFARAALSEVPRHFLSWVNMTGFDLKQLKESTEEELAKSFRKHTIPPSISTHQKAPARSSKPMLNPPSDRPRRNSRISVASSAQSAGLSTESGDLSLLRGPPSRSARLAQPLLGSLKDNKKTGYSALGTAGSVSRLPPELANRGKQTTVLQPLRSGDPRSLESFSSRAIDSHQRSADPSQRGSPVLSSQPSPHPRRVVNPYGPAADKAPRGSSRQSEVTI
ncbi:Copine-A [Diplonema papillatum]|nr:Copine-A [Diplonema papillatum]